MADPVLIKEVIRPADQGLSRPYLCRSFSNDLYYVKGRNTDPDSMYKEWGCAHLAESLNLPIPAHALVELDEALVDALPADLANIGVGLAFGSKAIQKALWFEQASVADIPAQLQRRVVAFDWWIQNLDRSMHNSNLLLDDGALVVIDHNNAFDTDFDPQQFIQQHIFADEGRNLFSDYIERNALQNEFRQLAPVFSEAIAEAPEEWKWYDSSATVPSNFDTLHCNNIINRCFDIEFWNI
ncbi:HipA family kinase [Alloalcanivorax xenomutans]|uniref:Phosphatidylinositol 4-kinase n=1 Tax=Alloalcanivorax xenomutans TaxID=1094342 RepID=A0A9Q3W151_9GAMM|nr:HipA family kinase [Alloalcanivorax xenomutans]MCE7507114.1 phosphatidylinositol 4-kinase [Alloalcanivorax xenomutans]PHS59923.1 MAG: hypothetical protein COB00_17130 [Alcanivorax sp.]